MVVLVVRWQVSEMMVFQLYIYAVLNYNCIKIFKKSFLGASIYIVSTFLNNFKLIGMVISAIRWSVGEL